MVALDGGAVGLAAGLYGRVQGGKGWRQVQMDSHYFVSAVVGDRPQLTWISRGSLGI